MKPLDAIALLVTGVALAGCVSDGALLPMDGDTAPSAVDGIWCGFPHDESNRVYINIRYASSGLPSASPDSCEVRQGTHVTWRGPQGSPIDFELDFPGGPPGRYASLESDPARDDRQKVEITASSSPGTYKYGIAANGEHVDPDLKIKPN